MTRGLASYWKKSFFHSLLGVHIHGNPTDFKVSEETWVTFSRNNSDAAA